MIVKNMFRNRALLLLILVFMMPSLACGSSEEAQLVATAVPTDVEHEQPAATATSQPIVIQTYKPGDVVAIGDSTLVVLGWEKITGTEYISPDPGRQFIAVELLIVNNVRTAISISTLLQMSVKDECSQKFGVDLMASSAAGGGSLDGELSPGEKVRGRVGFDVPENAGSLQFVFDADVFGAGKVFVDLGSEPIMLEAPAEVMGEVAAQSYAIGSLINIGTVAMVVNGVSFPAGDQYNHPDDGYQFVLVDLTLENQGEESVNVSSLLQMSLKDDAGQKYTPDLMASVAVDSSSPEGEIVPGEKIRGQVGFQVPEDADGLVFVFDADVWGTGKIFVALS